MNKIFLLIAIPIFVLNYAVPAQTIPDPSQIESICNSKELKGLVLDAGNQSPLPYATVLVLHKNRGVISNESGAFSINIADLDKTDTLCFQYIGYKTKTVTIGELDTSAVVYLKVDIINLSDFYVFGNAPDPESIVKQVIKNKDTNYKNETCKRQAFIRRREITDIDEFSLEYQKSTIPELGRDFLKSIEDNIPKHSTSYRDFLGNLYFTENQEDSVKFKIEPVRTVELKEKEIDELEQYEPLIKGLFEDTGEKEYWQVKSGIFGEKFSKDEVSPASEEDTLNDNKKEVIYFRNSILSHLNYCTMDDKDQWEFLYHTGRYDYTLSGGASVNGEDVYIIDFVPHNNGLYTGRMFISTNTYALIRADYEYAPDKIGRHLQLLGIGYAETQFSGSIFFEKKDNNYIVKYFSTKEGGRASIDRDLALYQKKKRFLWDEKLQEFKVGINTSFDTETSFEYLVLDDQKISEKQFVEFLQPEKMEIIYVDQFDDKLWSGYPIIEPTKQMKEYRKQEIKFGE